MLALPLFQEWADLGGCIRHLWIQLIYCLVCVLGFCFSLGSCHSSDMVHTLLRAHADSIIVENLTLACRCEIWELLILLCLDRWLLDNLLVVFDRILILHLFTTIRIFRKYTDPLGLNIWATFLIRLFFVGVWNKVRICSCLLLCLCQDFFLAFLLWARILFALSLHLILTSWLLWWIAVLRLLLVKST